MTLVPGRRSWRPTISQTLSTKDSMGFHHVLPKPRHIGASTHYRPLKISTVHTDIHVCYRDMEPHTPQEMLHTHQPRHGVRLSYSSTQPKLCSVPNPEGAKTAKSSPIDGRESGRRTWWYSQDEWRTPSANCTFRDVGPRA